MLSVVLISDTGGHDIDALDFLEDGILPFANFSILISLSVVPSLLQMTFEDALPISNYK